MGEISFTKSQQEVIDTRGANILVSAAAGSGKTEVLTQRILSLMMDAENPIDIDRMLILSFTKAAAAEMRERIGKKLSDRMESDPDNERLWKQQTLLSGAQITTIDSFCLYVIRNNFADIAIDPGFRIMDEGEAALLLADTAKEVIDSHFAGEDDPDFKHLYRCYCNPGDDGALERLLIKLHNFVMSDPDYSEWIKMAAHSYILKNSEDICELNVWKELEPLRRAYLNEIMNCSLEALEICNEPDGPAKSTDAVKEVLAVAKKLMNVVSYQETATVFENMKFGSLPSGAMKDVDKEKRERVKELRNRAKNLIEKYRKDFFPNASCVISDSQYVQRAASKMLSLLDELIEVYKEKKKEACALTFSDLEHYALQILTKKDESGVRKPTRTALEYRDYFDVIMVDEYQDSNYVQEYILKSIAREDNYFMVGDIKQSIYGFRQATPEIFANKYNSFSEEGINKRIDLSSNFRSRSEVVDFVNKLFEFLMNPLTSMVAYDDKAKLILGASYPDYDKDNCEILLLDKSEESVYGEHEAECHMVADRIKELMDSGFRVYDRKLDDMRPVEYKDIVILLRSPKNIDNVYQRVFKERGIPVYVTTKTGYFMTLEIKTILNYLSVIDNPIQDIPLYGTLTSYFGGLSEEELAIIKAKNSSKNLYDALITYDGEASIKNKIEDFIELLAKHREYSHYMGVRELLTRILEETGFAVYMSAYPDGDRRKANIEILLERATAFEKTSYHGLFHFLRYIDELKKKKVDYGEADTASNDSGVVRIMSVHGSKGLEFPVCFLSGTNKKFNEMDSKSEIIVSKSGGLGLDLLNPDTREKRSTLQKRMLIASIKHESMCEEIRILYVALTRAREKLIITGEMKKAGEFVENYRKKEASFIDSVDSKNVIELIFAGLAGKNTDELVKILDEKQLVNSETKEYISRKVREKQFYLDAEGNEADQDIMRELKNKILTTYPHSELRDLYVKTSVTELKRAALEEEDAGHEMYKVKATEKYIPSFARKDQAGSERKELGRGPVFGTAMHRLMELFPFEKAEGSDLEQLVSDTIKSEVKTGKLTKEQADIIMPEKCVSMLKSKLGQRMIKAATEGKLYEEKSFFYGMDADRIRPEFPKEEMMLIQGIIDVYFEEDGELVLADYKTDAVKTADELVKKYRKQLEIYSEALEAASGKKVKEMLIYSFYLNEEIVL